MTSKEEYGAAVRQLVDMAQQGTGGGRVAAQVLLSAYNGYDYQLDVSALGNLDRGNFELAMTVIRGRYETGIEPHNLIPGGGKVFNGLWDKWHNLHIEERGKVECPQCNGHGLKFAGDDDEKGKPCTYCDGKGRVCACKG
jgi:hypothetical protein